MRVLHIADSPTEGGAYRAMSGVVACLPPGVPLRPWWKPTRWQHGYRTIAGRMDRGLRSSLRMSLRLMEPDVVHLHNFKEWGTAAIAACKAEGIPVVWSCYDYWPLTPYDVRLEWSWRSYRPVKGRVPKVANLALVGRQKRILKWMNQLDAIVVLSRASALELRRGGISPEVPTHIVPVPIDTGSFPLDSMHDIHAAGSAMVFNYDRPPERNRYKALYLGGPAAHKGGAIVGEITKHLRHLHLRCPYGLSHADALREIASAGCLLVPEQWPNPGPVVIAEAQLLGTPVVASHIGGIPEMRPAALVNPQNVEGFARECLRVVEGDYTVTREEAQARHDPKRIASMLSTVYEGVIR